MLKWGAGLGVLLGEDRHLQLGPEVERGASPSSDMQKRTTNLELLLDARYRVLDDFESASAPAPASPPASARPTSAACFMIAYTPEQKRARPRRRRHPRRRGRLPRREGRPRPTTPRPTAARPPPDRDGDGIPDDDDACPDVPGVRQRRPQEERLPAQGPRRRRHPRRRGRLPRRQGRRAPTTPRPTAARPPRTATATASPTPRTPAPTSRASRPTTPRRTAARRRVDTDGDGILDDEDACPDEKGVRRPAIPKKNGCPQGRARHREGDRHPRAGAVRHRQGDHQEGQRRAARRGRRRAQGAPGDPRVEVQGHTDNRGDAGAEQDRSRRRAPTP